MWPKILRKKKDIEMSYSERKTGFTIMQVITSLLIMVIIAGVAIIGFQLFIERASKIIMKHDLRGFVKAQEFYLEEHGRYFGTMGDVVHSGQAPSGTLTAPDFLFTPSDGVRIEIISGDGQNYLGPPAFKAMARHDRSKYTYEYDFSTKQTTERKN